MYTRKAYATREAPSEVSGDQPEAREGQAWAPGGGEVRSTAEPGNSGEGSEQPTRLRSDRVKVLYRNLPVFGRLAYSGACGGNKAR